MAIGGLERNKLIFLMAFFCLVAAPAFLVGGFTLSLLYMILIYVTLSESWNILGGYAGQICLGIGAFFGVGGYAAAMLSISGLPVPLSVIIGGFVAVLLGFAVTPTLKLRGVYFAIGTFFLPEIMKVLILNLEETGGAKGLFLPFSLMVDPKYLYLSSLLLTALTIAITHKISTSRIGLAFRAIREDEEAAECCGINPLKFKLLGLVLCAFLSGLAGGIHAHYLLFLDPHATFNIMWSISPVFMAIIGGVGTLSGPIIGAGIFTLLKYWITTIVGEVDLIVMGSALIAVVLLMPEGIIGVIKKRGVLSWLS